MTIAPCCPTKHDDTHGRQKDGTVSHGFDARGDSPHAFGRAYP